MLGADSGAGLQPAADMHLPAAVVFESGRRDLAEGPQGGIVRSQSPRLCGAARGFQRQVSSAVPKHNWALRIQVREAETAEEDKGPSAAVCCQRLVCSLHVFSAKETADYTHVA